MSLLSGLFETVQVVAIALVSSVVGRKGLAKLTHSDLLSSPTEHKPTKSVLVDIVGFLTISTSIGLVELVLCEICDWLSHDIRVVLWSITTKTLLVLLTAVVPTAIVYNSMWIHTARKTSMIAILAAYLVFFWFLGGFIHQSNNTNSSNINFFSDWSSFCLLRIGFIGITATATLAGFSSVSTPYEMFIARPKPVALSDIERLQRTISSTRDLLTSKRGQMDKLSNKLLLEKQARSKSSLMLKMMSSLTSSDSQAEFRTLQLETNALETMLTELDSDIFTMKARYESQQAGKTLFGKLQKRVYMGFAVYCIYRLIRTILVRFLRLLPWNFVGTISTTTSSSSSSSSAANTPDAIVTLVASFLHGWTPYSKETVATLLHLTITGALFLATFSSTLTTLKTLTKAFPPLKRTANLSGDLASLITSDLLGVYVIATALTLRSILPATTSTAISVALRAPLDPTFVQDTYENTFSVVALATAAALFLVNRVASNDLADSEPFYDEEAAIDAQKYD